MFTREELLEFFSDRYNPTQIIAALHKLAEVDSEIDPEGKEFPASVTDKLEQVFKIIEDALDQQKQLAGETPQTNGGSLAQVQQLAIDLASDRAVNVPQNVFNSLVEILVGEALVNAEMLAQIQEAALKQALAHKSSQSLENLGNDAATRIQLALKLVNDPEMLNRILKEFGVKPVDEVEADLVAMNVQTEDFDPDAFLAEVALGKKKGEIMATPPKTIADTKAMVRSLVNRTLQPSKDLSSRSL